MERRILVVEDQKDIADLIAMHLRDLGHVVDCVHDGGQGYEAARAVGLNILATLKAELGGDAVVLSSTEVEGGVEIVAIAAGEITRQRYLAAASSTPPRIQSRSGFRRAVAVNAQATHLLLERLRERGGARCGGGVDHLLQRGGHGGRDDGVGAIGHRRRLWRRVDGLDQRRARRLQRHDVA